MNATFLADFASFQDACAKAEISLKGFDSGAGQVERSLNKMADSFSGRKIIQDAQLMATVFADAKGQAIFTTAELARMGAVGNEALEKLRRTGEPIPANLQAMADAAKQAAGGSDTLGQSWILRIAEGQLLRDAVHEVLGVMKEMGVFLPELALRGAMIGDVEESFHHLAAAAGLASEVLLGTLRAGTHGTIDDFQLMQRVNKDLAAGLDLTDQQFKLLADGAFALAQATGGDTKDALDQMSDAMVTGRAKGVAMLTGKIDLTAAEDAYAAKLGGTRDQLTAEQKLEADREAILDGVSAALGRVGAQTDGLDEKVEQARVAWANFEDGLGKAIALSPVIAEGFDGIKASLIAAFGGDQQAAIDAILVKINEAAVVAVDFAIAGVEGARDFNIGWSLVKSIVLGVEAGLTDMAAIALSAYAALAKGAASLPLASQATKDLAIASQAAADSAWALAAGFDAEAQEAAKGITGHSAFDRSLDTLEGGLMTTRDAMIAASAAHAAGVPPIDAVTGAVERHTEALKPTAAEVKKFADAWDRVNTALGTGVPVLDSIDASTQGLVHDMHLAGVSVEDMATATGLAVTQLKLLIAAQDTAAKGAADWAAMMGRIGSGEILTLQQRIESIDGSIVAWARSLLQSGASAKDVALMYGLTDDQVKALQESLAKGQAGWKAEQTAIAKTSDLVRTLAGDYISAAEAKNRHDAGNSTQIDVSTQAGRDAVDPKIAIWLHDGYSLAQASAIAYAMMAGAAVNPNDPLFRTKGPRVPGFEAGGPTGAGGMSILHPQEYVVPKGGALVMREGGGTGGGIVVTWTGDVVVQGSLLSSKEDLAAYVGDGIVQRLINAGFRPGPR